MQSTISGRTIAKNAGVLMISQLITWGLAFLLTIFLPRYLGPQGFGQLQLASSLWVILAVIAALGTDTLITKEIARAPDRLNELLGTTLVLRALIFMLGAMGMAVYIRFASYPRQTVNVIWVAGISYLVLQLSGTFDAALKGLERMEYTSLAAVVSSALLSFLRIGLLLLGFGVIPIAAVGIVANIASLTILVFVLRKYYSIKLAVSMRAIYPVFRASLPYFLVTIGIVLYGQVDTVIISLLADEKTIGWYGASTVVFGTLLFIPNVFITALFPALNRAYADSQATLRMLARKSLNVLILVGVPLGWGLLVISNQLTVLLFGADFANSGPVLAVRGFLLIFTYINMLLGFLLISIDRQKAWAAVMLAATIVTILLDLILIPWALKTFANGALGGAFSYIFTETGMIIVGFLLLPRGIFSRENGQVAIRVVLAGLVLVGATWLWRDVFILIPILIGAALYIIMILLLRAIPKDDWDFMVGMGTSFFQRLRRRLSKVHS